MGAGGMQTEKEEDEGYRSSRQGRLAGHLAENQERNAVDNILARRASVQTTQKKQPRLVL